METVSMLPDNKEGMEIEVTVAELNTFLHQAEAYQKKYPQERSQLTFSLIKQSKRYAKKVEEIRSEFNGEVSAIRTRNASVDKDENLIQAKYDVKQGKGEDNSILQLVYKKEAKIKMEKEIEEFSKTFNEKTVKIKPPYATEPFFLNVPANFDFGFLDVFKKFIFSPKMDEATELELYLAQKPEKKPTIQSVLDN